jgi:hypothetical protein
MEKMKIIEDIFYRYNDLFVYIDNDFNFKGNYLYHRFLYDNDLNIIKNMIIKNAMDENNL